MLLQTTADEGVELLEPVLELRIAVGITVDLVDRIEKVIEGGVVGEALDNGLYICQHWLILLDKAYEHTFRSASAACSPVSVWAPLTVSVP